MSNSMDMQAMVEKVEANILLFEEAIEKEIQTIKEYRGYRASGDSPYDDAALIEGEERCRNNIGTFEEAIDKERALLIEHKRIAKYLEDKPEPEIHIEVVRDPED